MNELDYLKAIEALLHKQELDCSLEPDIRAPPFGRILVFLGSDPKGREKILVITAQSQELGEPSKEPRYIRIQFEVAFPFEVNEMAAHEVASLFAFLNRMLELPGFEFDEIHGKIFYRIVHLTTRDNPDETLFQGLIGVISLLTTLFLEPIEEIASGKNTFNNLLENILQLAEKG